MSDKLTLQELSNMVNFQEIGYAVTDYLENPNRIKDAEVRKLWKEARKILRQIEEKLPKPYKEEKK